MIFSHLKATLAGQLQVGDFEMEKQTHSKRSLSFKGHLILAWFSSSKNTVFGEFKDFGRSCIDARTVGLWHRPWPSILAIIGSRQSVDSVRFQ